MQKLGTHLLLELWQIDADNLNDVGFIRQSLIRAAEQAACTVVSHTFHRFAPQGVSGVVVIAESHISIHTWPELGYASVDIFTCGDHAMPQKAAEFLVEATGAGRHSLQSIDRGIPELAAASEAA